MNERERERALREAAAVADALSDAARNDPGNHALADAASAAWDRCWELLGE
jgi:tRNA U38,U39,U40 pseudouridine synthase TruA